MASYSSPFKEQAVRRLMPSSSQTVSTVSQDLSVVSLVAAAIPVLIEHPNIPILSAS